MGRKRGLAHVLKKIREKTGFTQAQLAKKVGVTREYITMLESGARKNPTMDTLKALAKALGVPMTKLLG